MFLIVTTFHLQYHIHNVSNTRASGILNTSCPQSDYSSHRKQTAGVAVPETGGRAAGWVKPTAVRQMRMTAVGHGENDGGETGENDDGGTRETAGLVGTTAAGRAKTRLSG